MKSWLKKFKISAALDDGGAISQKQAGPWSETEQFAHSLRAVHDALKATAPRKVPPNQLHGQIMRSVRATTNSSTKETKPNTLRWWPIPAMAVLALTSLLWFSDPSNSDPTTPLENAALFSEAAASLKATQEIAQSAPTAAIAPLSREMELLRQDVERTTQFLLSSIP